MSKKLLVCVSLLVILSLVIVGAASSCAPKETKVLRLSYPLPEFDLTVISAQQSADEFNEAAKGEYKIEIYAGGVLAGMHEAFEMVREGALDMCDFSTDHIAGTDLVFGPQTMPFVLKDRPATLKFLALIREALWQDLLRERYNIELLSLAGTGSHDWAGTVPIYTMEDWKGTVVWVSNPVEAEAMELLGASPVTLDWNEGYAAMEKGVVDGCVYGAFATLMSKWEAIRYLTVADAFQSCGSVCINLDVFNSLPKNLQEVLVEAYNGHGDRTSEMFNTALVEAAETLEKEWGVESYQLPTAERAIWEQTTKPVVESYYAKIGPADAQLIQDLFDEANR